MNLLNILSLFLCFVPSKMKEVMGKFHWRQMERKWTRYILLGINFSSSTINPAKKTHLLESLERTEGEQWSKLVLANSLTLALTLLTSKHFQILLSFK